MKTILKRSIAVSLLLFCLSLSIFADGDMGAGSKTGGNSGGLAATTNSEININSKQSDDQTIITFIDWITAKLAETFC
jgi:hypothetical protein